MTSISSTAAVAKAPMGSTTLPPAEPIQWFKRRRDINSPLEPVELSTNVEHMAWLAQADLLLLIAQLLASPTTKMQDLLTAEVPDINELLRYSKVPNPDDLAELFQSLRQQAQTLSLETWAAEYNRLFEGAVLCPINESGFIRRDKGAILADIAGFYRAFGMKLVANANEKVDHLICELEFVALLLILLVKTKEQDNPTETQRLTHDALSSFSFDHLGEWLPAFCERLTNLTALPFYQYLAQLLLDTWSGVVAVNHLPVANDSIAPSADMEIGTPYECDMSA